MKEQRHFHINDWIAMFVTRETRRLSEVEQELFIVKEHLSSLPKTRNPVCHSEIDQLN